MKCWRAAGTNTFRTSSSKPSICTGITKWLRNMKHDELKKEIQVGIDQFERGECAVDGLMYFATHGKSGEDRRNPSRRRCGAASNGPRNPLARGRCRSARHFYRCDRCAAIIARPSDWPRRSDRKSLHYARLPLTGILRDDLARICVVSSCRPILFSTALTDMASKSSRAASCTEYQTRHVHLMVATVHETRPPLPAPYYPRRRCRTSSGR